MALNQARRIGREAILLLLSDQPDKELTRLNEDNWQACLGKVGSMEAHKVVAAIETAAKKNGLIKTDVYRESHALYHAIMEALQGVTRGQVQLGSVHRTVGLTFAILRGNPYENNEEGEWMAVSLYGTIGAPVKGSEHEAIGLGINHI
ncbi:antitermination protein [Alkalihalobacillus alcalophilus ATCC 27647 = CGMCC 1.3604]|uniref:Hut operon positive regulatory protein n=1 Tax=Alkalihalobacillus alcalophilus ATCC 27647 = CGMCC 1.3604 TaxID=1218173 RepID=A0A094WDH9_ALKAL|nr:hut operon transcriptional regulator HutP [Alkalihalobacillus alcalophilus]KGA95799.1 Hut operon positive regulatory protein [Alkalihalobacillus alcalophilus ATCC 27647 = CGMCC 1.3604]MED1563195.1 hut operon transcriptional regulator HutP [Alkalihalobacillus alcalophilus]THG91053.1 antitermination protein [Alkalihalobacillus alcalophilus ATCC 27647 = CGMCC 1.3604]